MSMMRISPGMEQSPHMKLLLNTGGGFDGIAGHYLPGKYGEDVRNAGLGFITGIVGPGNNFKSTILNDLLLKGMSVIFDSYARPTKKGAKLQRYRTSKSTYDTEVNIQQHRLSHLAQAIREFDNYDLFDYDMRLWEVTDKTVMWGNEYFDKLKEFIRYKRKNAKAYMIETPFMDAEGKQLFSIIMPTFGAIDSLTDFQTENESDMMDKNELGESGANTLFARSGLFKTRLLTELPGLCGGGYHFLGLTAQMNKEMGMGDAKGGPSIPQKKLQYLTTDQKIVGATTKFTYATTIAFNAGNAKPLVDDDRMAEYARPDAMRLSKDTDLIEVTLTVLRNKNGKAGMQLKVLVTQLEGIQFELTEFHNLREAKRFGIAGSGQWYNLTLYPDCAIQRTTIRKKIQEDSRLRRAIHITHELQQMQMHEPDLWAEWGMEPKELYEAIKKQGFDWDSILDTRGSYRFNNDCHPIPYLSLLSLLKMAAGTYFPYWMDADKKSIKPEFQFEADLENKYVAIE